MDFEMVAARECAARKCSQAELERQCGVSTRQFNGYVKKKSMAAAKTYKDKGAG